MEQEGDCAVRDTENMRHGNGQVDQRDTGRNIQPCTPVPPTVLVTELNNGTLIIQARPDGLRVRLGPTDAVPLKRELAAAFGRILPGLTVDPHQES